MAEMLETMVEGLGGMEMRFGWDLMANGWSGIWFITQPSFPNNFLLSELDIGSDHTPHSVVLSNNQEVDTGQYLTHILLKDSEVEPSIHIACPLPREREMYDSRSLS